MEWIAKEEPSLYPSFDGVPPQPFSVNCFADALRYYISFCEELLSLLAVLIKSCYYGLGVLTVLIFFGFFDVAVDPGAKPGVVEIAPYKAT